MRDKEFLTFIYHRLRDKYHESPDVDFMTKLESIIAATPKDKETPNTERGTLP